MDARDLCELCHEPIDWNRPTLSLSVDQWDGSDGTICEPCSLQFFADLIERRRRERIGYDGPIEGLEAAEQEFDAEAEERQRKWMEEYRKREEKSLKHLRAENRKQLRSRVQAIADRMRAAE